MREKSVDRGMREDRAVSEAVGFMIIFAIILAGIGLVTLYGYPMLLQQQSNSDEQIMEKNLIVLQNDLKSIVYKTVPYKETSLKVGGGTLTVYNSTSGSSAEFQIYGSDANAATCIKNDAGSCATTAGTALKFLPGDIRYESASAQTGMSVENGAVVKRMVAINGSSMLAEPRWFFDSDTDTAVIYLISFNTSSLMARSGVGTVKMQLGTTNTTTYSIPSGNSVYVTYKYNSAADYSTAWRNYFTRTLGMTDDGSGTYHFTTTPTTLVIKKAEIIIKSV